MSRRVTVVGGSGKVGTYVIRELLGAGYEVTNVDRTEPAGGSDCPLVTADVRDAEQTESCIGDADAIVHLAAYPTADADTSGKIFRDNTWMTHNVLTSAARHQVPRIVNMSTAAVIYYPHPEWYPFAPRYLPVDEEHPVTYKNTYSLSKHTGELIAGMVSRLGHTVPVSLRPAWIVEPHEIEKNGLLDPDMLETGLQALWSYVDVRDVAIACRLAIEANLKDHEILNISAPDTFASISTSELIERYLPSVTDRRDEITGYRSLLDCRKAKRLLGFEARFSARD